MKRVISFSLILFLTFSFSLFFLKMCAPASWNIPFRANNWYCENAVFVSYEGEDYVIVEGFNRGGYRSPDIGGLCVVKLSNHMVTGTFYKYRSVNIAGVSESKVYVYNDDSELIGLSINDLKEEINITQYLEESPELNGIVEKVVLDGIEDLFRIYGKDGYEYSFNLKTEELVKLDSVTVIRPNYNKPTNCYDQIMIPKKIKNKPIIEGKWLCELGSSYNTVFENDDRLLSHKTLRGEDGKYLMSRVGNDEIVWQITEKEIKEQCDLENPLNIYVATNESTFLTFFQDGGGNGDLYIMEIDSNTGEILWSTELF